MNKYRILFRRRFRENGRHFFRAWIEDVEARAVMSATTEVSWSEEDDGPELLSFVDNQLLKAAEQFSQETPWDVYRSRLIEAMSEHTDRDFSDDKLGRNP